MDDIPIFYHIEFGLLQFDLNLPIPPEEVSVVLVVSDLD